jgi:bacilysin biosynthesis oxidoreductase BacG
MTDETRVAVIVGGSAGIGKASAVQLAGKGCRVVLVSREGAKLADGHAELRQIRSDSLAMACDMTDAAARARLFEQIDRECGRIDILVNSIPGAEPASFLHHDIRDIEDGISKKLIPYLDNMKRASHRMMANRWGRIVNVVGNMWKEPEVKQFNFGLVNAAIVNAAKAASFELAPYGITVNGVHPGSILTNRLHNVWAKSAERQGVPISEVQQRSEAGIPQGRVGQPEEAAALIAFLVSEEAGFITGQQISVDGGQMRSM